MQAAFCATLVDEWVRAGLTDAVVAPGSRSTPVVAALAADGRLRVHVVLDERSAGFVALGLGLATGRPAPVVTTSGTASVELHPAVVEAHQARVPMIAVTADRPPELHHVGAPQTVEQEGLFAGALRWAASPGVPDDAAAGSWRSLASRLVAEARSSPAGPGPVHLNLAFREPLLGDPAAVVVPDGRAGGRPWHRVLPGVAEPAAELVDLVASHAGRPGLVVAGGRTDEPAAVIDLAARCGWPLLADPRSGCRLPGTGVVGAADLLLRHPTVAAWTPEIVLRFGDPPASKVLATWLADLPPEVTQVLVDPAAAWADPGRTATVVAAASARRLAALVAVVAGSPVAPNAWSRSWADAEARAQATLDILLYPASGVAAYPGSGPPNGRVLREPAAARALVASLPAGTVLVTSSSMPVRDVEWFAAPRRDLRIVANRGANGIDGVVSTAIGVAASGVPTALLVGDLAFAYDTGALLWATRRGIDLTVVVVDNGGGGIFSFLPQAAALGPERFERFWGTPHGVDLLAIASAYGLSTAEVVSAEDLAQRAASLGRGSGVQVLRWSSDRRQNVADHRAVEAAVTAALDDLFTTTVG